MNRAAIRPVVAAFLRPAAAAALFGGAAQAQMVFSIDYFGATIAASDSFSATPITEGDLLTVATASGAPELGPLPTPGIDVSAGAGGLGLALHSTCVGHPPGTACGIELDAVSYGKDKPTGGNGFLPGEVLFSTDEFAVGFPAPLPPNLATETGAIGDVAGDALATPFFMPAGPLAPFAVPPANTAVLDANGLVSLSGNLYPGIGLREPNFPVLPPMGDDMDALNIDGPNAPGGMGFPATGVYFSLDSVTLDPLTGVLGSGSAQLHGFSGADVLLSVAPGGPPIVYAPSFLLGLDLQGALDDLDALALAENGVPGFQPSAVPYDWLGGGTDMLLFSVRRGSGTIGRLDSAFGIPIEAGDILTTPIPTGSGGVSPWPAIFIAAENLGLATARTHGARGDELDALDLLANPMTDCNNNNVEDLIDIALGNSSDVNGNSVPDECELIGGPECFCSPNTPAPCANFYLPGGCRNSTGVGSILSGSGTSSVILDDLVLTATQVPTGQWGIIYRGTAPVGPLPFGDGLRCVGGTVVRFPLQNSGAVGILSEGPGIALSQGIGANETWWFQAWFRDPGGPCGTGFNTSNAFRVDFTL